MKSSLQLKQSQHLALTPQLQQAIRLLQLSALEVNQEVSRILDENPLLEREDDDSAERYALGTLTAPPAEISASQENAQQPVDSGDTGAPQRDEDWPSKDEEWGAPTFSASPTDGADDEERPGLEFAADGPTLREHLLWQLNTSQNNEHDKQLIGLLIDALDDNGYLAQPLEEIVEMLPPELDVTLDDLETALIQLQHLDEPGIGARSLCECLTLQIKALPADTPSRDLALRMTAEHLTLLAAHDFFKLKRLLRCNDSALRTAQTLIAHLKPRPGAGFAQRASDYVVPDVVVERHKDKWQVRLNKDAMPRLRVNQMYANILQQRTEKNVQELSGRLQEARWFIKNLQQRFDTILRVSQAIVDRQRHFLEHGEIAMRPLVLREIADELELHESTISRVTTQKFMLTPRGIYEFKYFFSSGLATESGGTCSSKAIHTLIKQFVSEEDAKHPLTDSRMAEILAKQGILVARRTVAKYREMLNILPVNLRKSL